MGALWLLLSALSLLPGGWYDACRAVDWLEAYRIAGEALASDTTSAEIWAAASLSGYRAGLIPPSEAAGMAGRALALDSTSALAWAALGTGRMDTDIEASAAAFERAIEADSQNVFAWEGFANLFERSGEAGLAAMDARLAAEADPLFGPAALEMSRSRCMLGDTIQAIYALNDFLALSPGVVPILIEKGRLLEGLGLPDSAYAAYSAALAVDSASLPALQGLGLSCETLGRWGEAVKAYRRMIGIDPGYSWAYGEMGYALESVFMPDSARAWYMRGMDADPGYAWAAFRLGLLSQGESDIEGARIWLETATRLDPLMHEAWMNRGLVEEDAGDYEAAAVFYRAALALDSTDIWTWGELGYVLSTAGRYGEAAEAFETAIGVDSSYSWGWEQRGLLFEDEGREDEAIAWYRRAWKVLDSTGMGPSPWMLGELGMLLEQAGQLDSAGICYGRSLEMDSTYSFGTLRLARLYETRGLAAEAEPLLLRYAYLADDSAVVLAELSTLWRAAGDTARADQLSAQSLEMDPGALVSLAWSYFYTGHEDRAGEAALAARSTGVATLDGWLSLTDLYSAMEEPLEQNSCYEQASLVYPDDPALWMSWGSALSMADEYEEAEGKFLRAVELDSLSIDAWNYLGESLLFQDRFDEARSALDRALELDNSSVFAVCYLGLIEERKGDPDTALDMYLEALRLSPGYPYAEERIRSITDPSYDATWWREESSPIAASVWADISLEYGNVDHKTYSGGASSSWTYGPRGSQVLAEFHGSLERINSRRLENTAYASVEANYFLTSGLYVKCSSSWDRQPDTVRPWQISSYSSVGYKEWIREWLWISPEVGAGMVNSQWYLEEKKTSRLTAFFSLGIWMEKAESLLPTLWVSASCYVPPDRPEDLLASGNAEISMDLWDRLSLSIGGVLDFTNRPVFATWERLDSELYTRINVNIF
jgi:tetratricopeptide (TPR) repeat protein